MSWKCLGALEVSGGKAWESWDFLGAGRKAWEVLGAAGGVLGGKLGSSWKYGVVLGGRSLFGLHVGEHQCMDVCDTAYITTYCYSKIQRYVSCMST